MTASKNNDQWDTISEGSPARLVFDTIGDVFTGTFEGYQDIELDDGSTAVYLLLRGNDGELYQTSRGYSLGKAFSKIDEGSEVRITYIKNVQTGQPTPMKDFKVEVRR